MSDIAERSNSPASHKIFVLSHGWSFKQTDVPDSHAWLPVRKVPSTVHQDLIDNHQIAHPFVGFNEIQAEWIGTKSWTYRITFSRPQITVNTTALLAFDGLDTFACVRLNGQVILRSSNMFIPYRIDVTDSIIAHRGDCVLEVEFASALLRAREIEKEHPKHKFICFNGETARLCVRKAQYHWGWDWGPLLMCAGIWREARIETYTTKIIDLRTDINLSPQYDSATFCATIDTEGRCQGLFARFTIALGDHIVVSEQVRVAVDGRAAFQALLVAPQLWMPNGYGKQTLYRITATIFSGGVELHSESRTLGIRKIELVQQLDVHGKSFFFRINGIDVFCGGSCWIPADSFLTEVTPERYRAWLELLVPANQKMVRIWGGGIYEEDSFYNICDELGILVWQDFMFGCGNYPAYPDFLQSVEAEAIANVRRLRHHPSIVLFAGNNEDYQVQEQAELTYNYEDMNEENWLKTDFPARIIYESVLPRVMKKEAPAIPYHPGSPWGDGKPTSDATVGDMHQWNVWHGTQEKYQKFDSLGGRFNSEFGMEALPHVATIKSFVERPEDLYAQSHVLDFHNKADGHERRMATYLVENVRGASPLDLETHIHLTQLIQSEALMFGYRGWRKQWGDHRRCGGALVWQLNDCWPVTSWSIVDYHLRRKPAYYALARVLAPLAVGIRRQHYDWSITHARKPPIQSWELWIVSALDHVKVDIEVRFISVETGREIKHRILKKNVQVTGNGTTNVMTGNIDNVNEEPHVLAARLFLNDEIIARDTDWPQPFKYLTFPRRNLIVDFKHDGTEIRVTAERPVKCLVFEEREGCHLSDSAIDVLPGDPQIITVKGLKADESHLSWKYLGVGEQT